MPTNFVHERGSRTAHRVATRLSVEDPADVRTLRDAYLVTYEFPAPLMVRVADDMLADLRADVADRNVDRVVTLGRDGHRSGAGCSGPA
ncbi:hypothetical protein AB0L64_32155 [Kribbella sp. NPDC051936]|uniref:hypothetical protein n=1 Tax=Kribbella sp. NPDC051936 TaxID=3154946 RepID=UPI00342DA6F2